MTRRRRTFSCVLFCLLACAPTAWAAPARLVEAYVQAANGTITSIEGQIPGWTSAAAWNLGGAIIVGLLGVLAAALQLFVQVEDGRGEKDKNTPPDAPVKKRLSRLQWAVITVGAVISAVTLVMNLAFAADHREYRKSVAQARQIIGDLRKSILSFERDPDIRTYDALEARDASALTESERADMNRLFDIVVKREQEKFGEYVRRLGYIEERLSAVAPLGPAIVYAAIPAGPSARAWAESNDAWQAEQNSFAAAAQKMVAQLIDSSSLKLSDRDRDLLPKYVEQYARKQTTTERPQGGRVKVLTELTMTRSYANPALIGAFLRAQSPAAGAARSREQLIEQVRLEFSKSAAREANFDTLLEAKAMVPLSGGTVALQAKNPSDGDFLLRFAVQPSGRQRAQNTSAGLATVRLESMEIRQDSSPGSTRWIFYVLGSDGRVVLSLPEQRWDDSKRPTVCWWAPEFAPVGQATAAAAGVALTVVALKPKLTTKY